MKKTDIAMIVLIAAGGVLVSYFVVSSLPIFKDVGAEVKVKTADPISAEVIPPDPTVFNKKALNPTIEVFIGDDTSKKPDQPESTTPENSSE